MPRYGTAWPAAAPLPRAAASPWTCRRVFVRSRGNVTEEKEQRTNVSLGPAMAGPTTLVKSTPESQGRQQGVSKVQRPVAGREYLWGAGGDSHPDLFKVALGMRHKHASSPKSSPFTSFSSRHAIHILPKRLWGKSSVPVTPPERRSVGSLTGCLASPALPSVVAEHDPAPETAPRWPWCNADIHAGEQLSYKPP